MAEKSKSKVEVEEDVDFPLIFDFTDYREYLKTYYRYQKSHNPAFSYRYFSKRAHINSSGIYKNVIDGKRSLGRGLILRFGEALKLRKKEMDYFEAMVYFTEAKDAEEKKVFFNRMMSHRKIHAHQVKKDQYEYYSQWYYPAIRELLGVIRFKNDFANLAKRMSPAIKPEEAVRAISVLENLGFIAKDDSGIYRQSQNHLTTGPDVRSANVVDYQISCMDLAKEAIERHDISVRDISTLTLSLSAEAFEFFKQEIISCRKKLLGMEKQFPNPDRVYQLNMQFFPISKAPSREKI